MATVGACGFECGLTAVNSTSAHHFNNNGTTAIDTGTVRPGGGARSLKVTCNGSAANAHGAFFTSVLAAANTRVLSFYVYIQTSLPSANAELFRLNKGTAGRDVCLGFEQSSSKLCVYAGTNFAGRVVGPVITANTWYRIDLRANSGTLDWQVNGSAQSALTIGGTTGTYGWLLFGHNTSADVAFTAFTAFYDDLAISATSGDYPLADSYLVGYVPNADGSHNTGGGSNFTNAAATAITDATTNANTYLDEIPPTTTDRVEQRLDTSGARYVEVRFNSTGASAAPLSVDFTTVWRAATAASAAGQVKMRDNAGTTDDAVLNTTIAVTTDTYAVKHYAARPAALGAWTQAALQDLRARFGFGTDVTPDIWFGGIVAEARFAASETHSASITATGGGVLAPSSATVRTRTQAITGGGILTPSSVTTRTRTQTATGGGVATIAVAPIRAATVTATGGGVATVDGEAIIVDIRSADVVATGGGVATTVTAKRGELTVAATGGGMLTQMASSTRTAAVAATGGGVATVTPAGVHATTVAATGAGIATASGAKRAALTLSATGAGVASQLVTTTRTASVGATGGGTATVDGTNPESGIRTASIEATGGGVASVAATRFAYLTLATTGGGVTVPVGTKRAESSHGATGGGAATTRVGTVRMASPSVTGAGTIPIDAETWRLASVLITGGGIATLDAGPWVPATPGNVTLADDPLYSLVVEDAGIGSLVVAEAGHHTVAVADAPVWSLEMTDEHV